MKKQVCLILILTVLLSVLCGCSSQEGSAATTEDESAVLEGITVPQIPENYFALLCDNTNLSYYVLRGSYYSNVSFYLIAARDLVGEKLTFCSDIGEPFQISIREGDGVKTQLRYDTFLTYQGVDWKKLAEDEEAAEAAETEYQEAYDACIKTVTPLYLYSLWLPIDKLGLDVKEMREKANAGEAVEPGVIRKISVTLDGVTKEYEIDNLQFVMESFQSDFSGELTTTTFLIVNAQISYPTGNGAFGVSFDMTAKENLVLEGVSFWKNDAAQVLGCKVNLTLPDGSTMDIAWDGKSPLDIDKGTSISLHVEGADPILANQLTGSIRAYTVVHYSCNGVQRSFEVPANLQIYPNPYEIYAAYEDGLDVMAYYLDD